MARTVLTYDAGAVDAGGASVAFTSGVTVTEAALSLSNNTTANVSTSKHGLTPILPNDATKYLDGTGAYTVPSGGGGIPATIFDAKGDLIAASAADTAARLAVGANGKALIAASGETTGLLWNYPPGYEFDYAELTSTSVSITGTSAASPTNVVSGNAVTYDGSTVIVVEFAVYAVAPAADGAIIFNLFDGSTDLGRLGIVDGVASSTTTVAFSIPVRLARRLTPSAASHTFHIKAWRTVGNGTIFAGAGGTDTPLPGFIRITKA